AALADFIKHAGERIGKREIARHFGLGPADRVALKAVLRDLAADGVINAKAPRRFSARNATQDALLVEITGTDPEGDAIGRPVTWQGNGHVPIIFMAPEKRGEPALAPGARVLAQLKPIRPGRFEGRTIRRLAEAGRIIGLYRPADTQGGRIIPTDRRAKAEWLVPPGQAMDAEADAFVRAEPLPWHGYGLRPARIVEIIGSLNDPRAISRIAIAGAGIPDEFPPEVVREADAAHAPTLQGRDDLRHLPLVTIDGEDARDFDDAVFAEPNGTGFRLVVAIADVAAYVASGTALDCEALRRGNSVYFPDRVVPMLPEALSNHWCSLRPNEDRACLYVELLIDASGRKQSHKFGRGLMRSAARLTYEQMQAAMDGAIDDRLPAGLTAALESAFRALLVARQARGTLDLDLPERQVLLGMDGRVQEIRPRARLASHRLIEEFMVLANVAAAEALAPSGLMFPYRVHAPPTAEKLDGLREFLATLEISLPAGDRVRPGDLDAVLARVAGTEQAPVVNETILRSQSQAEYAPVNIGHFGLALSAYAHFTSPIRRYADLLVHRALIRSLKLGTDGLTDADAARVEAMSQHITNTERRAAQAERDATDRYLAVWLAESVGASFDARVSGVTRFGLFVTLRDSGASGIVPLSSLGDDFWVLDEKRQALVGRRSLRAHGIGQGVRVCLAEATPLTGGLVFRLLNTPTDRINAPSDGARRRGRKR
ncbi:MAG: ribonuclease R, partial [Acidocella sp.]|nr:ribonuclease R [Acidocella sp.]